MKTATIDDVEANPVSYFRASAKSPVIVTRNGKAFAAIIPLDDDEALYRLKLSYNPKLQKLFAESERRIENGEGIPHDEFWKRVHARYAKRNRRSK